MEDGVQSPRVQEEGGDIEKQKTIVRRILLLLSLAHGSFMMELIGGNCRLR